MEQLFSAIIYCGGQSLGEYRLLTEPDIGGTIMNGSKVRTTYLCARGYIVCVPATGRDDIQ